MHTLPALRAGALALACVLAPAAHATSTIELLTGIPRLACEATPACRPVCALVNAALPWITISTSSGTTNAGWIGLRPLRPDVSSYLNALLPVTLV